MLEIDQNLPTLDSTEGLEAFPSFLRRMSPAQRAGWLRAKKLAAKRQRALAKRYVPRPVKRIKAKKIARNKYIRWNLPARTRQAFLRKQRAIKRSSLRVARLIKARNLAIARMRKKRQISENKAREMRQIQLRRLQALRSASAKKQIALRAKALRLAALRKKHTIAEQELINITRASYEGKVSPILAQRLAMIRIAKLQISPAEKQRIAAEFQKKVMQQKISYRQLLERQQQLKTKKARQALAKIRAQRERAKELYKANLKKAKITLIRQKEILEQAVKAKVITSEFAQRLREQQIMVAKKTISPIPKKILRIVPTPIAFHRDKKVIVRKPLMPPRVRKVPKKIVIILPIMVAVRITPTPRWKKARNRHLKARDIKVIKKEMPKPRTWTTYPVTIPTVETITKPAKELVPEAEPKEEVVTPDTKEPAIPETKEPNILKRIMNQFLAVKVPKKFW